MASAQTTHTEGAVYQPPPSYGDQQAATAEARNTRHQQQLQVLGIFEIILGLICFSVGVAIVNLSMVVDYDLYPQKWYPSHYDEVKTTGAGIWGGFWVVIAGAVGICSARPSATICKLQCNLALVVIAAVFSVIMIGLGIRGATVWRWSRFSDAYAAGSNLVILNAAIGVLAFIVLILLILSAHFTSAILKCNSCCKSQSDTYGTPKVVYMQQPGVFVQQPVEEQQFLQPVAYAQPSTAGGVPMAYPQQPASSRVSVGYPQQPVVYVQQPPNGGHPVMYAQQPIGSGPPIMYGQQPPQTYQGNVALNVQPTNTTTQPESQEASPNQLQMNPNAGADSNTASGNEQQEQGVDNNAPPSHQEL